MYLFKMCALEIVQCVQIERPNEEHRAGVMVLDSLVF